MREPDVTATLDDECEALMWMRLGPEMVRQFAATMGVPEADTEKAVAATRVEEREMRAWKIEYADDAFPGQENAAAATWVVNGPFHMAWRWWMLFVIHLRPSADMPEPKIERDGASHEVLILSFNPENGDPDVDALEAGTATPKWLTPVDLNYQVIGLTDEQAAELAGLMVQEIASGRMSPDSDFRASWQVVLDETATHLRYGGHPERN